MYIYVCDCVCVYACVCVYTCVCDNGGRGGYVVGVGIARGGGGGGEIPIEEPISTLV
jgi:hypothetical protein